MVTIATIGDFIIHGFFILISIFSVVQSGKIISFKLGFVFYIAMTYNFLNAVLLIWLSKEVIESRYNLKLYTFYVSSRILGHLINLIFALLNLSHQTSIVFEEEAYEEEKGGSSKKEQRDRAKLEVFMVIYASIMILQFAYVVLTSYFYTRYRADVILMSHVLDQQQKEEPAATVGTPLPEYSVGVPIAPEVFESAQFFLSAKASAV